MRTFVLTAMVALALAVPAFASAEHSGSAPGEHDDSS
jgi:hypothetical protein